MATEHEMANKAALDLLITALKLQQKALEEMLKRVEFLEQMLLGGSDEA